MDRGLTLSSGEKLVSTAGLNGSEPGSGSDQNWVLVLIKTEPSEMLLVLLSVPVCLCVLLTAAALPGGDGGAAGRLEETHLRPAEAQGQSSETHLRGDRPAV